jgi:hypothetical protein
MCPFPVGREHCTVQQIIPSRKKTRIIGRVLEQILKNFYYLWLVLWIPEYSWEDVFKTTNTCNRLITQTITLLLKPQNTSSKDDKSRNTTLATMCYNIAKATMMWWIQVFVTGLNTLQIMKAILIDVSNQCLQLMTLECTWVRCTMFFRVQTHNVVTCLSLLLQIFFM